MTSISVEETYFIEFRKGSFNVKITFFINLYSKTKIEEGETYFIESLKFKPLLLRNIIAPISEIGNLVILLNEEKAIKFINLKFLI